MTVAKRKEENNVVNMNKEEQQPVKKRKRLTLGTAEQVRRYIQGLMVKVENNDMTESKARLLTNQAEVVLKAILQRESDSRLAQLEAKLIKMEEDIDL